MNLNAKDYDFMKSFNLSFGSHESPENGLCVMEAVAMLAGEPHTDRPECADSTITSLAIYINDNCRNDTNLRNRLLMDLPWRIIGTVTTDKQIIQKRENLYRIFVTEIYKTLESVQHIFKDDVPVPEFIVVLEHAAKILDEMIKLTEIKEEVPNNEINAISC